MTNKKCNCVAIDTIRRLATIFITSAMSSAPTKAMFAMLNWLSSNLLLKRQTSFAAVILNAINCWPRNNLGSRFSYKLLDYIVPSIKLEMPFEFNIPDLGMEVWLTLAFPNLYFRYFPSFSFSLLACGNTMGSCGLSGTIFWVIRPYNLT